MACFAFTRSFLVSSKIALDFLVHYILFNQFKLIRKCWLHQVCSPQIIWGFPNQLHVIQLEAGWRSHICPLSAAPKFLSFQTKHPVRTHLSTWKVVNPSSLSCMKLLYHSLSRISESNYFCIASSSFPRLINAGRSMQKAKNIIHVYVGEQSQVPGRTVIWSGKEILAFFHGTS